jgi:Family of unknown function (DUF6325)
MDHFEYGPVELFLIGFTGDRPGPEVVDAILDLVRARTVNVLDLLFAGRSPDGELRVIELEEVADEYGFAGLVPGEPGLAGEDDIAEFAEAIAPGTSAALLIVEHAWARSFAEALNRAGGRVLRTERISAPDVNELIAAIA